MTIHHGLHGLPGLGRPAFRSPRLDQVRADLSPLLDKIATGTLQRQLDGELPFEPVRWLKEAGYGALRVPTEYGGRGLSIPELTQTWVELAAADANLPQAFRGHFANAGTTASVPLGAAGSAKATS